MKNLIDDWIHPKTRRNEGEDMIRTLDNIFEGRLIYKGTTLEELKSHYKNSIGENLKNEDIIKLTAYFEKVSDYCLGKIIETKGYEQIMWYRRNEQIENLIEDLERERKKENRPIRKRPSYPFLSIKFSDN